MRPAGVRRHGPERADGRHADASVALIGRRERRARRRTSPHPMGVPMRVIHRRVPIAALAAAALLALPASAGAEAIEIGSMQPPIPPSCPARPCLAVSRTTGYQAKVGATRGLMTVPKAGRIVAWTIALGNPGAQQTAFFNQRLGGAAEAQLTILNPRRKLRSRVVAQGEPLKLQPFFGSTPTFALQTSLRVHKGWVVALTVTTWAPALAVGLAADTSWRGRPGRGQGGDTAAQTAPPRPDQPAPDFFPYPPAGAAHHAAPLPGPGEAPAAP